MMGAMGNRLESDVEMLRKRGDVAEIVDQPDNDGTFVTRAGRLVMFNEGGCASTVIDVRDLVAWLREHRPDLLA
jgi:hypothetical protein